MHPPSPLQLQSKSHLDHFQSSYTLHSSVKIYQLLADTSLKPQECNLLQSSVHICSDRQTLQTKSCFKHLRQNWGLLHLLTKPHILPCADTKGKDRQLAEDHRATEMCKSSKSLGKIPSSIPPMPGPGCPPVFICSHLLSGIPTRLLPDNHLAAQLMVSLIFPGYVNKVTKVHL